MIVGKEVLEQKIEYIHLNPVRRGYVTKPEHWQYSSAGKMVSGEDGVVGIDEFVW